jgi:hypothetical protein
MAERTAESVIRPGTFHAVFSSTAAGGWMGDDLTPLNIGVDIFTGHSHYRPKALFWQSAMNQG